MSRTHLIAPEGMSYIYDGDGDRIEKCTEATDVHGNPLPGVCAANATGTVYWLHPEGGTLAESDLSGNPTAAYGIIRGQIASRVDLPAQTVHYYFHDHLGSTNVITDTLGGWPILSFRELISGLPHPSRGFLREGGKKQRSRF